MHKNNYSLEVLINGRPIKEFYKNGKSFVEAREGTEYTLKFRNNSWKRVLAIFSVDGVEVIKGRAAGQADNGYVIDAFSAIDVKGYRISEDKVASFRFASNSSSYSNTVGALKKDSSGKEFHEKTTVNNGVIGVRVIEEKSFEKNYAQHYKEILPNIYIGNSPSTTVFSMSSSAGMPGSPVSCTYTTTAHYQAVSGYSGSPLRARSGKTRGGSIISPCATSNVSLNNATLNNATLNSAASNSATLTSFFDSESQGRTLVADYSNNASFQESPTFTVGTSWGNAVEDKVIKTTFERSDKVTDLEIYYTDRESLQNYGIDLSNSKQYFSWPSAFGDEKNFCKRPAGYKE